MEKRELNCFQLSARSLLSGVYKKTQYLATVVAMSCTIVVCRGTMSVSLEKRSATTNIAVLSLFDSISGLGESILTYVYDKAVENSLSSVACYKFHCNYECKECNVLLRCMRPHSSTGDENVG